ncbi:unnamed protein product [Malus baccata var. baccata]
MRKAVWNALKTFVFCDCCIKEVEAGRRPELGRQFNRAQLNGHYGKNSKERKPVLVWSSVKRTIDASQEWRENKIQGNRDFAKKFDVGITRQLEEKLDQMLMNMPLPPVTFLCPLIWRKGASNKGGATMGLGGGCPH